MKKILVASVISTVLSLNAFAEVTPTSAWQDNRVKHVMYDEDNVVRIPVKTGVSTLIQFSKGETMLDAEKSGLGIGDPLAWDIGVRANSIFIRPIEDVPDTNMTIITNKRTYLLNLVSSGNPAWKVKFTYPESEQGTIAPLKPEPCMKTPNPNRNYLVKGDSMELMPTAVWDDGFFTCVKYATNKAIPLFYKKLPDGSEQIINTHIEKDTIVIHEVYSEYRLRLGDQVLGLKSETIAEGYFNSKGTMDDSRRVINE